MNFKMIIRILTLVLVAQLVSAASAIAQQKPPYPPIEYKIILDRLEIQDVEDSGHLGAPDDKDDPRIYVKKYTTALQAREIFSNHTPERTEVVNLEPMALNDVENTINLFTGTLSNKASAHFRILVLDRGEGGPPYSQHSDNDLLGWVYLSVREYLIFS